MIIRTTALFICFLLGTSFAVKQNIERIYVKMESKQLQAGKSIILKSEICFEQNGDMVTHFTSPVEYVVVTNKTGEIKIYDPAKNTVISKQANLFSTQSSQLVFFLSGKANDMGLLDLGFIPTKTYPENSLIVSEWMHKVPDTKSPVVKVKLVHQQQKPIYMHYQDKTNTVIRKVFYYGYKQLNQFSFPSITTEIIYNSNTDSVITKTTYSDFKLNEAAKSNYFGYKIPVTARRIN